MSRSFRNESRTDRAPRQPRCYTSAQDEIAEAMVDLADDPRIAHLRVGQDASPSTPADGERGWTAYTSETPHDVVPVKTHVRHLQPRGRRLPQPAGPLIDTGDCWREQTSRRTGFSVCQ